MVGTLDIQLQDHWFDSWLLCYQVVTAWMGDCLQTGKTITVCYQHQGQLASGVGKSSTD